MTLVYSCLSFWAFFHLVLAPALPLFNFFSSKESHTLYLKQVWPILGVKITFVHHVLILKKCGN